MWDLVPWPGIKPMSPAVQGGLSATGPLGKSRIIHFKWVNCVYVNYIWVKMYSVRILGRSKLIQATKYLSNLSISLCQPATLSYLDHHKKAGWLTVIIIISHLMERYFETMWISCSQSYFDLQILASIDDASLKQLLLWCLQLMMVHFHPFFCVY